jgi:hypothetical protein
MATPKKSTPASEAAKQFLQQQCGKLRAEAAKPPKPTQEPSEADLDYAYRVHGGSKIGPAPKAPAAEAEKPAAPPPPAAKPKAGRHYLRNPHGWVVCYAEEGDDFVSVRRTYRGLSVTDACMGREEARRHYRNLLNQGFTKAEGDL